MWTVARWSLALALIQEDHEACDLELILARNLPSEVIAYVLMKDYYPLTEH